MSKGAWAALSITILLFGALIWTLIANRSTIDYSKYDNSHYIEGNDENGNIADHYQGSIEAKAVIIEYGDYQCAGCASMSSRMNVISEEYGDKILFIFRNFPIQGHTNARAAASAAEVAATFGKFWEMHDLLYKNQSSWSSSSVDQRTNLFTSYAEQSGIDKDQFLELYNSKSKDLTAKVNFDTGLGKSNGVSGTPTFFLNGKLIEGDVWGKDETLKAAIDEALGKKSE